MGLKAKLILIILSIALLPPLTVAVQFAYQLSTGDTGPEIRFIATRLLTGILPRAVEKSNFSEFSRLPEKTDLVIISDERTIVYASSEAVRAAIAPAASLGSAAVAAAIATVAGDRDYYAYRYTSSQGNGTAYLTVPGKFTTRWASPITVVPVALLSMLGIASLISMVIIRNLGRSIRRMEDAMLKIASGDLDFPAAELTTGDLASLGQSLDRMRAQLKDDRERRDRFIMGVSHDLKTPLAVIQGYIEALGDGMAKSTEHREMYLEIMRGKADLLGARIAHLIELAKTTTSDWRSSLEESNLGLFLEETLAPLADFCAIRGYILERKINLRDNIEVAMDRDMVTRIFENLIENAVAYGDGATPISVIAEEAAADKTIVIRVENGGPGISEEDRKKVFEPFFRGTKSRADGGFGLGLASVKSIVESHGWTIRVDSEPGSLTAFTIEIPRDPGRG